jgi:hypothetical protein
MDYVSEWQAKVAAFWQSWPVMMLSQEPSAAKLLRSVDNCKINGQCKFISFCSLILRQSNRSER